MNHEEAVKKAEEIVWVDYNLGDIYYQCAIRNIPICGKNKKPRKRSDLETELINAITKELEK